MTYTEFTQRLDKLHAALGGQCGGGIADRWRVIQCAIWLNIMVKYVPRTYVECCELLLQCEHALEYHKYSLETGQFNSGED